jgi:hypothetical protein
LPCRRTSDTGKLPSARGTVLRIYVPGEATYESLAHNGEAMTTAEIVTYAYDQTDRARAELNAISK